MRAICPKCGQSPAFVNGEMIEVKQSGTSRTFKGISYSCPSCNCFLSVQIDPIAVASDGVAKTLKALGKD